MRFGNVLGSSGSAVPIFRRQIAAGGPVMVTDSRMTRYFMTVPEAVQLIIRAGSLSQDSGAVLVLEMGEPVNILELAETMIRLSGFEPERDIAIQIVGARPGEKLSEDLFNPLRASAAHTGPEDRPGPAPGARPYWVTRIFDEINLLVLDDQAAPLARRVCDLARARSRIAGVDHPRTH